MLEIEGEERRKYVAKLLLHYKGSSIQKCRLAKNTRDEKRKKEVENGAHNKSFFFYGKDFFIYSKDSWQKFFSRGLLDYKNPKLSRG